MATGLKTDVRQGDREFASAVNSKRRQHVLERCPGLCEAAERDREVPPLSARSSAQLAGDRNRTGAARPAADAERDRSAGSLVDAIVEGQRHLTVCLTRQVDGRGSGEFRRGLSRARPGEFASVLLASPVHRAQRQSAERSAAYAARHGLGGGVFGDRPVPA